MFSAGFAYTAYNIAWFNLQPPPYMTKDAVYDSVLTSDASVMSSISWTYPTREYSASLECVSGQYVGNDTYTDGRGCYYQNLYLYQIGLDPFLTVAGTMAPNETLFREVTLTDSNRGNCSNDGKQIFTMLYSEVRDSLGDKTSETALFCSLRYTVTPTEVSVTPGGLILSANHTGPSLLLEDSAFNASQFEEILTQGAIHEGILHDDFPTDVLPDIPEIDRGGIYVST